MTVRLSSLAVTNWELVEGYAITHGIKSVQDMPLGSFTSMVSYLATENAEKKDKDKFRQDVWRPPKGVRADPRSPWSPANEKAAFDAVKAMVKG